MIVVTLTPKSDYNTAVKIGKKLSAHQSVIAVYRNTQTSELVLTVQSALSVDALSKLTALPVDCMREVAISDDAFALMHPELTPEHPRGKQTITYLR